MKKIIGMLIKSEVKLLYADDIVRFLAFTKQDMVKWKIRFIKLFLTIYIYSNKHTRRKTQEHIKIVKLLKA